jgi:hypothetical protein
MQTHDAIWIVRSRPNAVAVQAMNRQPRVVPAKNIPFIAPDYV